MSLLEQDTTKKGRVDKEVKQMKFDADDDSGEYKIKTIRDNAVYTRESNQAIYQVSTIWSHKKDISRKKILKSQP